MLCPGFIVFWVFLLTYSSSTTFLSQVSTFTPFFYPKLCLKYLADLLFLARTRPCGRLLFCTWILVTGQQGVISFSKEPKMQCSGPMRLPKYLSHFSKNSQNPCLFPAFLLTSYKLVNTLKGKKAEHASFTIVNYISLWDLSPSSPDCLSAFQCLQIPILKEFYLAF